MDGGSERRFLARGSGAALRAADHGSGLRLPVGQRRGAGAIAVLAAELVSPHHRAPAAASDVRPRRHRAAAARQPPHLRVHSPARDGRSDSRRRQPRPRDAAGDAGPDEVRGARAGGDVGRHRAAPHFGEPVLSHDGTVRVLLARPEAPTGSAAHRAAARRRRRGRAPVTAPAGAGLVTHARRCDASAHRAGLSRAVLRNGNPGFSEAATCTRPDSSTGAC